MRSDPDTLGRQALESMRRFYVSLHGLTGFRVGRAMYDAYEWVLAQNELIIFTPDPWAPDPYAYRPDPTRPSLLFHSLPVVYDPTLDDMVVVAETT